MAALAATSALFAGEEPKDHLLFVGSDFTVKVKDQLLPVVGAGNRTFIIKEGAKETELPLRKLPDIQVSRGLKLTRLSAKLSKINAIMTSDVAVAESHEATQTIMAMQAMATIQRDRALGEMLDADFSRGLYNPEAPDMGGSIRTTIANLEAKMKASADNFAAVEHNLSVTSALRHDLMVTTGSRTVNDGEEVELTPEVGQNTAYLIVAGAIPHTTTKTDIKVVQSEDETAGLVRDLGNGRSDRFDLDFDISSAQPLENAYVVVVTEYSAKENVSQVYRRVLTEKIGQVGPTPRRIRLYQTGFPPGFRVRTYLVNLYSDGQEVATNLSDTKMAMTREEAFQYVVAEYLAKNKGQTLPPAAVLMTSRSQLRQVALSGDVRTPVYVSVDENGQVTEVSTDSRRKSPPPPTVVAALQHFFFVPALQKGVPASGRAKLVVSEFFQ